MARRGPMPLPYVSSLWGPRMRPFLGSCPYMFPPSPPSEVLEHRLATQNAEIQRLASENQRLAATHVALREELHLAQNELERLRSQMAALENDKELQIRSLLENNANLKAGLQAAESIKADLQQARIDAQISILVRQDLTSQVQKLTQELQRAHAEVQQIPSMHTEIEGLRKKLQQPSAFMYEKATEKLSAEIARVYDKRGHAMPYGDGGGDGPYPSSGQSMYGDVYGMSKMPVAPRSVAPYATGGGPGWGGYDMPPGSGSHVYR